jgi:hypothetical protein
VANLNGVERKKEEWMINLSEFERNKSRADRGCYVGICLEKTEESHEKLVWMFGAPAKIRTEHAPNMNLKL